VTTRSSTASRLPQKGSAYQPTPERDMVARAAQVAVPTLIAIALALRLTYYLSNPSLSTDEARVALNLIHRSYVDLFGRLDFNQAAPPGFLLLQKLVIEVFGASTYSLRLLPFLAGVAACLLLYSVAARTAGRSAAIVALALFAVLDPILSYASTNKQYSLDVAAVLAVYATALAFWNRLERRRTILLAPVGVVAVLVSHAAAFVLAAIWIVLAVENGIARRWREVARLTGVAAVWLGALATAYLLTSASIEQIQRSSGNGWGPPTAAVKTIGGIARYLLGIPAFSPEVRAAITSVALGLCFMGIRALSKKSPGLSAVLIAPAIIAGAAVWIGRYPNYPRAFLFVVPALVILVATGALFLFSGRHRQAFRVAGGAAIVILFGVSASQAIRHLREGTQTQPTRALAYLTEHTRPGDALYVARAAQYTFRYYLECGCFGNSRLVVKARTAWPIRPTAGFGQFDAAFESAPPSLIAGTSNGSSEREYAGDLSSLLGRRRVWFFLVDQDPSGRRALSQFLQNHGRRLDVFPKANDNSVAPLFLYTLRRNK
jgi:hypothetical protein